MKLRLARFAALAMLLFAGPARALDAGPWVEPDANNDGDGVDRRREAVDLYGGSRDAGPDAADAGVPLSRPDAAKNTPPSARAPEPSPPRTGGTLPLPVVLSLASASPVLGVDAETEVRIVASSDTPLPLPRVVCSAGRVEDVVREGPTSFSARFILPPTRFPQIVLIVADFSRDALILRGTLVVRLRAATSLGFDTEPRAKVTVQVGEREFGPVNARRDGSVRVPVVVPLGIDFALARSVSVYGKSRQQLIDLKIPSSRRMLVLAPEKLAAGTAGEVVVVAAEPNGQPVHPASVLLASSGPRPQPLGGQNPGEARFLVRAPAVLVDPTLHLTASLPHRAEIKEEVDLVLVPAATAQITLEREPIAPSALPPRSLRLYLSTKDAFGNATDPSEASILVDGRPVPMQPTDDGRAFLTVRPSSTSQDIIAVEAALESAYAVDHIPLSLFQAKRPPPLFLATRYTLTPRMGLLWNTQQAPGSAFLLEGLFSLRPGHERFAMGMALGYLHSRFSAGNTSGAGQVILDQIPILGLARYRHRVQRLALAGGLGLGVALVQSRIGVFDDQLSGRSLALAWELSAEASFLMFRSQAVLGLRYLGLRPGRMSNGDVIAGNSGGLLLDAGYRYGW